MVNGKTLWLQSDYIWSWKNYGHSPDVIELLTMRGSPNCETIPLARSPLTHFFHFQLMGMMCEKIYDSSSSFFFPWNFSKIVIKNGRTAVKSWTLSTVHFHSTRPKFFFPSIHSLSTTDVVVVDVVKHDNCHINMFDELWPDSVFRTLHRYFWISYKLT